jgi:hypothetical protein
MKEVELTITFYPSDLLEIEEILREGRACGVLEHILALAKEKQHLLGGRDE